MTEEIINPVEVETPPQEPSWFIDEGIPGVGDRPQWLDSKFKTAADLGKSYRELEKKISTPPDEYDLSNSKFLDGAYEPIQEFLKLAKDKRVPKEVVDKMIDSIDKYMDEFSVDYSEEAQKLGEGAKERLTTLDNWAKANLTKASYEALTGNLRSADSIKALEELRGKMMSNNTVVPAGKDSETHNVQSIADIQAELSTNLAKYKSDPKYQADIRARLEIATKNSHYIDKSGA
jgi:hypothetical protein